MKRFRIYTLEFPLSRSKFYPDVLRAARTIPQFAEGELNVISLSAPMLREWLRPFAWIHERVRKWKGARLYIDDVPLDDYEEACFLRILRCFQMKKREHWCPPCRLTDDPSLARAQQIDLCPGYEAMSRVQWPTTGLTNDEIWAAIRKQD